VPDVELPEAPAGAYSVALPTFEGPLDLLLHLCQKHELDILDIPIGFVTEKYLEYLAVMSMMNLDVASEYLVMAATLAHIKSKMLLPDVPDAAAETEEEEEEDPRAELIRRLLEYQKYKAAGEELGRREMLGKDVFPRGAEEFVPVGPAPFAPIGTFDLLDAFAKLLDRTKTKIEHEVVFDRISISDRITEVVASMQAKRQVPFEELFQSRGDRAPTRFDLIITFLAVLEMARLKMLRIYQAESLASIFVELMIVTDEESAEGSAREEAPPGEDDDHAI
jgi:segregation and condensation protein A